MQIPGPSDLGDTRETVKTMAAELGLDTQQFNTCMDEQRYVGLVQSQDEHRRELGIRTRPTFNVNGQFVVGVQSFAVFQATIDPMLIQ